MRECDQWVIPEKIHTSPTDGKLEIQVGRGVERAWKSRWEGGCKLENSSSGVNIVGFAKRKSRKKTAHFAKNFAGFTKGKFC